MGSLGRRLVEAGETWGKGVITLIGDSTHPTTPALGQGGCMALEASYASSYGHVSCSIASIGPSWHTCTCCALHQCQPFGGMQDGVELGAALRDATVTAGVSWPDMPAAAIESALRDFERRRSTRCAPLIAKARGNIRAFRAPTSFLVGLC